jgi:hypothetical protein
MLAEGHRAPLLYCRLRHSLERKQRLKRNSCSSVRACFGVRSVFPEQEKLSVEPSCEPLYGYTSLST